MTAARVPGSSAEIAFSICWVVRSTVTFFSRNTSPVGVAVDIGAGSRDLGHPISVTFGALVARVVANNVPPCSHHLLTFPSITGQGTVAEGELLDGHSLLRRARQRKDRSRDRRPFPRSRRDSGGAIPRGLAQGVGISRRQAGR